MPIGQQVRWHATSLQAHREFNIQLFEIEDCRPDL
jgi:hypothetical protein